MNFQHSWFLWALLFLVVPILVHLFNFRKYQKIFFTNTKLIRELLEDTKKSSELKKKLILASRLLALLCLILAFAQPLFNSKTKNVNTFQSVVSIYVDNSYSMEANSFGKSQLEWAKEHALDILNSSKDKSTYQIISNDFNGNQLQLLSYNEALKELDKIQLSSKKGDFNKVFLKQEKTLESQSNSSKYFYWISDFQTYQTTKIENPKKYDIHAIPLLNSSVNNVYIDTAFLNAELLKLNQEVQLICKIKRQSTSNEIKSLVSFSLNETMKSEHEIIWENQIEKWDTFRFKLMKDKWNIVKLSIAGVNFLFDNNYYQTFFIQPKPIVTILNQGADTKFIQNAFNADDNFEVHTNSGSTTLPNEKMISNLLIMNQIASPGIEWSKEVQDFIKSGKNVVIFLNNNSSLSHYNTVFNELGLNTIQQKNTQNVIVKNINTNDNLLKNIFSKFDFNSDFPYSNLYFTLDGYSKRAKEVLISFNTGQPFLVKYSRIGEGNIYLFTSSIDEMYSNIVRSSVFAPLMFKLGNISNSTTNFSYIINQNSSISIPMSTSNSEKVFYLKSKDMEVIPAQRQEGSILSVFFKDEIHHDGIYRLEEKDGKNTYQLALNFSRDESIMKFLTEKELMSIYENSNVKLMNPKEIISKHKENMDGNYLWKYLLGLSLLFLIFEMLLILFFDSWSNKIRN